MRLFAIYDKKADGYKPPFPVNTIGEAERAFLDACNQDGSDLNLHPEDYQLWMIGEFDQLSGELTAAKAHVANGSYTNDLRKVATDG